MPTEWHYIDKCPLEKECVCQKTTGKKKKICFYGRTPEDAQQQCVTHLMTSHLHNKSKRIAWEAALDMEVKVYEEPSDEEGDTSALKFEAEDDDGEPRHKRTRLSLPSSATGAEPDPLVADLSNQICGMVSAKFAQQGRPSSSPMLPVAREAQKAVRAAKQHIADAETAARKAQNIAASAEQAFGDVARELHRAYTSLDGLV